LDSSEEYDNFIYPVQIKDKAIFKKDILIGTSSYLQIFATLDVAVCGNGICEAGETTLTCLQDCAISEEKDVFIKDVSINPSNVQIWKNNTEVSVGISVYSRKSYPIWARAVLYEGTTNEDDSGYISGSTNSTLFFNFKANHTTTQGYLRVYGKSQLDNSTEQKLFTYTVALDGATLGDSTAEYNFDFPYIVVLEGIDSDLDENAVKSLLDTIFIQTGLGYLALWLIIMFVVAIMVIFSGFKSGWGGTMVFSILAVVEAVLLVLGTLLGFVPIGIIITFAIIGILIGGIVIRKTFTGA